MYMDSKCHYVALNSRLRAEEYIRSGSFGKAFSHYLFAIKLNPSWKAELKELLSSSLYEWGNILESEKRYNDLLKCYQQAIEIFPDNEHILNNLGAYLLRFGYVKEAAYYFHKCLNLRPCFLRAQRNLENLSNLAVQRWHFRMLNDARRNGAFREAIRKKVKQGFDVVLDIGTGTGLLSLFALDAGAKDVVACDSSPFMIDIARQVLEENNSSVIRLVNKHSSDVNIPEDVPERVKLVVTETVDCGLFGEQILDTVIDAWDRLLKPPCPLSSCCDGTTGSVVPFGADIFIAGVECDAIYRRSNIADEAGSIFGLSGCRIERSGEYDCEMLRGIGSGFKYLTDMRKTFFINFNDPERARAMSAGECDEIITLKCSQSGRLDCFAVWFDLHVDDEIVLGTGPDSDTCDSWDQAIFPLSGSPVNEGDEICAKVSFINGRLGIQLSNRDEGPNARSPDAEEVAFRPSEELMETINSSAYGDRFLRLVQAVEDKLGDSASILDDFSFPFFGLSYLIRNRSAGNRLTCVVRDDGDRDFIMGIAAKHDLEDQVAFVTADDICKLDDSKKFDVVLLNLIERNGELRDNILIQMDYLRSHLKPGGLLLPEKVTLIGQVIESDWLERITKVTNNDVTFGFKIAEFVNLYKVNKHIDFDLSSIPKNLRSDPFEMFDVSLNQFTRRISVPVTQEGNMNAVAYWYDINFTMECPKVSTVDDSLTKQSAIIFPMRPVSGAIELEVIYDNGLFQVTPS